MTRFSSLIFLALLSYFQYSFRQRQRANFIATERIHEFRDFFRSFESFEKLRDSFEFSFMDAKTTDSQPELVRVARNQLWEPMFLTASSQGILLLRCLSELSEPFGLLSRSMCTAICTFGLNRAPEGADI